MILLRTTRVTPEAERLAVRLGAASGRRVAMLVDERNGPVDAGPHLKVGITAAAVRAVGLHAPPDFAWRCGDYGFYLAAARFPEPRDFWMVEHDVRIAGDATGFFAVTDARPELDMLSAHFRPAGRDWWWWPTIRSRNAEPHRCLFPVVRLSRPAIAALLAKRRRHARGLRRLLWPNDEGFVATTIAAGGFAAADLNALGQPFYDDAGFTFESVIDARAVAAAGPAPRLFHPVLEGEDRRRKLAALRDPPRHSRRDRLLRKAVPRLTRWTRW